MSDETERRPFKKNFRNGNSFERRSSNQNNGNRFKKHNKGRKNGRFLSNARGFAKKGNFGRGTHIEEDQFQYFFGILGTLNKPTTTAEERVTMANNVLEQTKGQEIHLASNQIVSKTLEALIGFSEHEHLERFFKVFGENFRPICSETFASHVLQKTLETAFIRAVGENKVDEEEDDDATVLTKKVKEDFTSDLKFNLYTEFAEDHRTKCGEFVVRLSRFLLNNLEDFFTDICGTHLIRSCILSLSGLHIPKAPFSKLHNVNTKLDSNATTFEVPSEWTQLMKEFPSRLQMWPQFKEFPYQERSAGLIGIICLALSVVDKVALKGLGEKLLNEAFQDVDVPSNIDEQEIEENNGEKGKEDDATEEDAVKKEDKDEPTELESEDKVDLPSVFRTKSSMRLLETVMSVSAPKFMLEIYSKLFKGRVLQLAKGAHTNYPVQKLINHITDKVVFEEVFDELVDHLEKLIEIGKASLVNALSGTCLRLNSKQAAFITALQKALHCTTDLGSDRPKSFLACMLKLKPFEVLPYDKSNYVVLAGSLIIQNILQFNKPIFLVNCILETPPKDLVMILQLPNGSFIADVFLKSKSIGEKSREKFIKLFEEFFMDLALERCGSRVLERLFDAANEAQKLRIAQELSSKENKLKGSVFGRIINTVFRLDTYKLSAEQWKASFAAKGNKVDDTVKRKQSVS